MKISAMLIGSALALGLGCATGSGAVGPQYDSMNHSAVMGVFRAPPGAAGTASCSGLEVAAYSADGNALVRRAAVRESRGHCAYELTNLPADLKLTLKVTPSPEWTCGNGTAKVSPDVKPFALQSYETRTVDFVAACG